jgi:hypothetical protein
MSTPWIDELLAEMDEEEAGKVKPSIKVCFAGEVEFNKATEADNSGRTVRFRIIRHPEEVDRRHPFESFTRKRRGHAGSRFEASFSEIEGNREFMMELMLLNWAANPRGEFVDFSLTFEAPTHPFMGCTRGSKDAPGTRFMMVAVEVNDDQAIVQEMRTEQEEHSRRTGRPQHLSNAARIMTKNERFHEWIEELTGKFVDTVIADTWLKAELGIASKADLDTNGPEALAAIVKFHKVRERFLDWQDANGYTINE